MSVSLGTAVGYLSLDYTQFSKNLKSAVDEASSMSGKLSDTLGEGFSTAGKKMETVGKGLSTAITLPLAVAGAQSVKFGSEFDSSMSSVKAVSGATTEEFNKMRDAAIEWGEKTVYTATEASDALYYMGLAGWGTEESINGLGPVLNLAAAGNLELGRTSDIVTDAMTAMNYKAGELTDGIENTEHFTNVLAATMSKSNTDVDQLGSAFKYVAPLAGSLGYSIDDLSIALGLMADMQSMLSFETKHLIQKGFKNENLKNPFMDGIARKNAYSLGDKITPMGAAFYIAPFVNAMVRSGTLEEKQLLFKSMLTWEAFKNILSTKRGHSLGEEETLVTQALRVATNVKNRQTRAQDAAMELIEHKIEDEHMMKHKVLLFLLEPRFNR